MNTPTARDEDAKANDPGQELARLREQIERASGHLAGLHQQIAMAASDIGNSRQAHLLEANARLLSATLRARTDAENAARALEEMAHAAELDALTQLPGRAPLLVRLAHAMASARRHGTRLALLFLDLDNFKQINDTLGHAVGDAVLKLVAEQLASRVRETDMVCRYGDDEFLVLLDDVSQGSDAMVTADKIMQALAGPHHVGDTVVRLTASIGLCLYPDDGDGVHALVDRAEAAMYRAKRRGPGSYCFHGEEAEGPGAIAAAGPPASPPDTAGLSRQGTQTGNERRQQQRDSNERLVVAALSAQELQSAAELALQRQTEFLAVLANELRNPLTPIRTATELLGQIQTDEALLPRLQAVIERQVQQMTRLVGDILDMARISSGTLRLHRQVVDLARIVDQTLATCRPAMMARRQQENLQMPADRVEMFCDPGRLAQVFSHLLENASKYTPEDGVIGFSAEVADGNIVMTVSDNGIGIAPEDLPHVFDPFVHDRHAANATGFNGVGLGVGLMVVRELVAAHGGTVVAQSAGTGLGSQFVVTLPMREAAK
jgi:diguanylate cyclase (GGDEF)-like protein